MTSLSRREQIYVGVFVITLLWGLWNYRGALGLKAAAEEPTPTAEAPQAVLSSLPPSPLTTTTHDIEPGTEARSQFIAPDWGTDPFHRSWRNTTAVPGASDKFRP